VKKDMLIEICGGKISTFDGLVNEANGLFESSSTIDGKTYIRIEFFNLKVGATTRYKYSILYTIENIESTWTPILPKVVEIHTGKSQSHRVTQIQFPIQLAAIRTIHRSQGLTLDELAFDPTNVTKHGLTYIALSRVCTKE
jgi:hypothetical protein